MLVRVCENVCVQAIFVVHGSFDVGMRYAPHVLRRNAHVYVCEHVFVLTQTHACTCVCIHAYVNVHVSEQAVVVIISVQGTLGHDSWKCVE